MEETFQDYHYWWSNLIDKTLRMNSSRDYLIAIGIALLGISLIKLSRKIIANRLTGFTKSFGRYLVRIDEYLYPLFYLMVWYGAFRWLTVTEDISLFAFYIFKIGVIFLVIRLITAIVQNAINSYISRYDANGVKLKQAQGIILLINVVLWAIGLIFLFDNLGFNVTAILTGLGVGGIAIALAAQTILGDIFNYFVIFFDQPFEVGDFIIVDDKMGTVENIGLKTTRVKSLSGEQIIFSNSNLTSSRIHNYKRMNDRRISFRFGIVYATDRNKLSRIPEMVKRIINALPATRFDRAHFASFGEYSLEFEVVYYVLSSEYNNYMDTQQSVNLELYQEFEKEGIQFAFPTYSLTVDSRLASKRNSEFSAVESD